MNCLTLYIGYQCIIKDEDNDDKDDERMIKIMRMSDIIKRMVGG